ncbi:MAG TPA: Rieske (2Fe-2S) protein [Acidimicrobiales bacterium]|nr:Rieske (2Fe-2S) protein [Acidimicrobiales bacterium]
MLLSFSSQGLLRHQWHAVARSDDLGDDEPVGVELLRDELVLWRGPSGRVIAAPDRCTHRKAALSLGEIKDGCVECSLHGWTFGEDGRCVRIPNRDVIVEANHLQTFACEERNGLVWVCPGEPRGEIPAVAVDDAPGVRRIIGAPTRWAAPAPRIIEALLDRASRAGIRAAFDIPFAYRHPVPTGDGSDGLLLVACSPVGAATSLVFPVLWTGATAAPADDRLAAEVAAVMALQPAVEAVPGMFEIDEGAAPDDDAGSSDWRRALLDAVAAKV